MARRFLDGFPANLQDAAWALLHKHPRFGGAFVAQAFGQAAVRPGEIDPGLVAAWHAAAERSVDESKDFYVKAIPHADKPLYEAAFKARWGEDYVEVKLGRVTQEQVDRRKRVDKLMAEHKASQAAGDSMFGPEASEPKTEAKPEAKPEATPAEAANVPAPAATQATPEQRRECLDDLDHLGDLYGTLDVKDSLNFYRFEAACRRIDKWREVFPASGDDASAATYPTGNPHKMLKQWERIRENAMRRRAEAKAKGDYHV